jgi:hypothetical protein
MVRLSACLLSCLTLSATRPVGPDTLVQPADAGIPFGLIGMSGRNLVDPYTAAMQPARPESVLRDLAAARARGARLILSFAGGAAVNLTDADGRFDYDRWKARLDRFLPITDQLNAYVADGTLFAAMLIDEPFVKHHWGGQPVPMATLDRMAQYSKSLFPGLPTTVGSAPSTLKGYPWRYLDVSWAQYAARKGPISEYAASETAAARSEGLGLFVGLNISKGGDGSSGLGGERDWSMSGAEILKYGHALLDEPYACAFISWDNRPGVVDRPDVSQALQELASAAKAHPETSCRQRTRADSR